MRRRADPVSFGSATFKTVDYGGFLNTDAWFPRDAVLPPHVHDRTVLAVTIAGEWDSVLGGASHVSRPGMVLTEPAGDRHANHFGRLGAHVVVLQPDPAQTELLRPCANLLGRVNHLADATTAGLGRRLAMEIQQPDGVSPLAIEALSLEILSAAARLEGRRRMSDAAPAWVKTVADYLHAHFLGNPTVADLSTVAGVHPAHLARELRRRWRMSVGAYVRRLRIEWAAAELTRDEARIADVAVAAGFADQSHFTRAFRRQMGITPHVFRRRSRN